MQHSWGCRIRNPARGQGNAIAPSGLGSRDDCAAPTERVPQQPQRTALPTEREPWPCRASAWQGGKSAWQGGKSAWRQGGKS
eukprot:5020713-Alexandrium_andersonii.AAC.1